MAEQVESQAQGCLPSEHRLLCNMPCVLVTQLCPTLGDPMECSPPGSIVLGIHQARILEWVTISFPSLYISNGLMGEKLCSRDLVVKAMDLKSIRVFLCRFATYWPWSFDLLDFPGGLDS